MPTGYGEIIRYNQNAQRAITRAQGIAATTIRAELVKRIHEKGLATNGAKIGSYSTKTMLVGAQSFITSAGFKRYSGIRKSQLPNPPVYKGGKRTPKGQKPKSAKKRKWATVKTPKGNRSLSELEGGYKKLRELDGRQTAFVDLSREGKMQNALASIRTKTGFIIGYLFPLEYDKMAGNEKRFGKRIVWLGDSEIQLMEDIFIKELNKVRI